MDIEEELIKTKGKLKINDYKLKAIVKLLEKEGIITSEEVDQELDELLKGDDDEKTA